MMRRQVKTRIRLTEDLEVHISVLTVDKEHFVEIRQFVPSSRTYLRGVLLPSDARILARVIEGISRATR